MDEKAPPDAPTFQDMQSQSDLGNGAPKAVLLFLLSYLCQDLHQLCYVEWLGQIVVHAGL